MSFGINFEWYTDMSSTMQIATVLATLFGSLVVIGAILVLAAKKTSVFVAVLTALVALSVGYISSSRSLPDDEWAHDLLLIVLLLCAIIFGLQWQKRRSS